MNRLLSALACSCFLVSSSVWAAAPPCSMSAGSSPAGIEDAVNTALAKANESVRNMQWFEVVETRGHIEDGKVAHYQVAMKVGFRVEE